MKNLDSLLEEAKWGTLKNEEIFYVVERIKNHQKNSGDDGDLYTLIFILGMADCKCTPGNIYNPPRGTKYRSMIESFLYYPNDTCITRIALKTLCVYWNYAEDYLEAIKRFIKGVDWDEDEDIMLITIRIVGEYLRNSAKKDPELLGLLIETWEKNSETNLSSVKTEAVYEALARASGQEWKDLLDDDKPNPEILKKAYGMVHRN